MSYSLMLIVTAVGMSTAAIAQPPEPNANPAVEISASGDGTWYVRCQLERDGSEGGLRELNKSQPSYRDDHMRRATCHYESSKKGLTIKITGEGWTCPFKGAPADDCTFTDNRLAAGEFRLVRSDR